ncbi:MAG TPA: hypothetical protein VFT20_10900 [Candidatus Limnocylindrales bacterium]|nr:hypothetical protein [Candidatus Limnocylindrales bacterium]
MRVRIFELRLIAIALALAWGVVSAIVLIGYRPGGPVDILVGLAAAVPVAIAVASFVWPPTAHGRRAFAAMVWLGLGSLLLLVPSIADVSEQLGKRGAQTLLPSIEAAYPWALALLGTSLFAGFGLARRMLGETAMRRRRLLRGVGVAAVFAAGAATLFTTVAMANELALRDRPTLSSRFGPTSGDAQPPLCDEPLLVGPTARLGLRLEGEIDGRSIGSVDLAGSRAGLDFRWLAYAATSRQLGLHGAARLAERAWIREPFGGWRRAEIGEVAAHTIDVRVFETALAAGARDAAEFHGLDVVEGARSRHCRLAVDGPTFRSAFPHIQWLVGRADLSSWRGELDYWIFLDGQLGWVTGSINGGANELREGAIQATLRVNMTATERGRPVTIDPPTR